MAFLFRDSRQKVKLGAKACPWSVAWTDNQGRRHSKRIGPKTVARMFAAKKERELALGLCGGESRITWEEFRTRFEGQRGQRRPATVDADRIAFNHFERLIRPARLSQIGTVTIERYVSLRSLETIRGGRKAAPNTINRELRSLRGALRRAVRWELIGKTPVFEMQKVDKPRPRILSDEDFAKLLGHCDAARRPVLSIPTAEWWAGLLVFARFTGWRVGEILSLKWTDLEKDESGQWWATTEAADNKSARTERVPLIPLVVEHLEPIRTFKPYVFPWTDSRRLLYTELDRIARAAKVTFPGSDRRRDVFHVFRKTFGTTAAMAGIGSKALASLMRHSDPAVTAKYYLDAEALMGQAVGKIDVSAVVQRALVS